MSAAALDFPVTAPLSREAFSSASLSLEEELPKQDLISADEAIDDFSPIRSPITQVLTRPREDDSKDYKLFLRTIRNGQKKITFKKPLRVVGEKDPNLIVFAHENTDIFGSGETYGEAKADFEDSFIRIFLSYTETADDQLSEGAKEFANRLRGMVDSCEDL